MSGKRWIKLFISFSILNIVLLIGINYAIDPFNIFHTNMLKHQFQMNERFIKIEFLEKNNKKFNGYMFGSSRIGTTPPSAIEQYIPNSKFYNFTMSGANLYDYITHLRYIIERKYPINTLYLQLDIEYMSFYGRMRSDYLKKLHPYVLGESLNLFYLRYLVGFFPKNLKGKIIQNLHHADQIDYFLNIGVWTKPDLEQRISTDCKKYVKSVPDFNKANKRILKYTTSEKSMKALSEIKDLCKNNNIKLYVFVAPHNKNSMDSFVINDYLRYLKDIANIIEFYDFSGYNTITTNNCNYYEASHYRPIVGNIIAGRIFNDKSVKIPDDFGAFVTRDNIDKYLVNLKNKIKNYDLNHSKF